MTTATVDLETVHGLVAAAVRAPSSHNTQPWRFRWADGVLSVDVDRGRMLPINDPHGRETLISCGAAIFNLRVAAAASGLGIEAVLFPHGLEGDCVAAIQIVGETVEPGLGSLAEQLTRRHTYRGVLEPRDVAPAVVRSLVSAADVEGATLAEIDGEAARVVLTGLIADGDRRQFADPAWRRELAHWIRPAGSHEGLRIGRGPARLTRAMIARFDVGESTATSDAAMLAEAPFVAALSTDGDGPWQWLLAGQALEHVLLCASAHGLQAAFFNQPCQVESLRPRLAAIAGRGAPQMVFRLGVPARVEGLTGRRLPAAVFDPGRP